jgi:hypothetical protein
MALPRDLVPIYAGAKEDYRRTMSVSQFRIAGLVAKLVLLMLRCFSPSPHKPIWPALLWKAVADILMPGLLIAAVTFAVPSLTRRIPEPLLIVSAGLAGMLMPGDLR